MTSLQSGHCPFLLLFPQPRYVLFQLFLCQKVHSTRPLVAFPLLILSRHPAMSRFLVCSGSHGSLPSSSISWLHVIAIHTLKHGYFTKMYHLLACCSMNYFKPWPYMFYFWFSTALYMARMPLAIVQWMKKEILKEGQHIRPRRVIKICINRME